MLTTRQKADYLMQVVKLRKLMILKDNPAFTYQHSNRKQAISRVHSLQDKIVEAAVDNQVYGNSDSVNHQKTVEQTISEALENDRKRVYKSDDNRYINTAVKLNTEKYSEILNNRLNIESVKLEAKIEEEIRKSKYNGLSEAEIKRKLTEEFKDTAKLRTANIIRDALHTNEVNIGFIHALQNGFQYKVWNNGRGKGKVRAWHRARFISSVSIDEPFDIFGSYHAEMMYPGDLNGGAENVANCKCWLSYTNQKPSNYKSKGYSSSTRNNSKSKQNTGSVFSNLKNRVSSLISHSLKFTSNNKNKSQNKKSISSRIKETVTSSIGRITNKLKNEKNALNSFNSKDNGNIPVSWKKTNIASLSDDIPDEIKKLIKRFENDKEFTVNVECGQVYNLTKGTIDKLVKGKINNVNPLKNKDYGNDKLIVIHSHTSDTFFSPMDIGKLLYSKEKIQYLIAITPNKIFIVKPKYIESIGDKAVDVYNKMNEIYAEHYFFSGKWGFASSKDAEEVIEKKYINDEDINKYISWWGSFRK